MRDGMVVNEREDRFSRPGEWSVLVMENRLI